MTNFRNKRFNLIIIAILWVTMHGWPIGTFAANEQFNAIQTFAWGPQAVQVTLKMGTEGQPIIAHISKDHPLSAYTQWEREPGGILRLVTHSGRVTSTLLPIDITLPKNWSGTLQMLGGEHRLRGTELALSALHVQATGNLDVECSGQINQLDVDLTGKIRWKGEGLKTKHLTWKSTGEGRVSVHAQEYLLAELVGSFLFEYDAPPQSVQSISQTGQSKIQALSPLDSSIKK